MTYLSFIGDSQLEQIVHKVLTKGVIALEIANKKFERNVIDPFSIIFEMNGFEINFDQWNKNEKLRQAQKSLSNEIGNFHQNILGSVDDWQTLPTGEIIDIVNHKRKIIAEVKNKHNTLKGSDKSGLYFKLEDLVMRKGHTYKDYTAYYIEIIPKKPMRYNTEFTPSNHSTGSSCHKNSLIRQIDGYSFYELATGVDDALEQLFYALPKVIKKIKPHIDINLDINNATDLFFDRAFHGIKD